MAERDETLDIQGSYDDRLKNASNLLSNFAAVQRRAEQELYAQQVRDIEALLSLRIKTEEKVKALGLIASKQEQEERLKAIQREINAIDAKYIAEKEASERLIKAQTAAYEEQLKKQGLDEIAVKAKKAEYESNLEKKAAAQQAKAKEKELASYKKEQEKIASIDAKQIAKNAKQAAAIRKQEANADKRQKEKANAEALKSGAKGALFGSGKTIGERIEGLSETWNTAKAQGGIKGAIGAMGAAIVSGLSDLAQKLNSKVDEIGSYRGVVDTRLQGSKNKTKGAERSYYDYISNEIVGIAGMSPLIKQQDIINNVRSMVQSGIAFNLEQRAFLQTIKERIADTFDANNGTLRRLIRIQQQDSTAARLGMESALNSFLNQMYETSEYLSDLATSVKSSLEEAQALMNAEAATELEYEMQKWLGSMYSVGMSQGGVNAIASTLGKLAAGDIEAITSGGAGNLAIMAANEAGLPLDQLLEKGLDASDTNKLISSIVSYLDKIYNSSKGSKVIQQQIAKIYGLTASDLKAISNMAGDNSAISKSIFTYSDMLGQLQDMAGSLYSRTSMGERLSNLFDNVQYSVAAGIANSPALYGIYKFAGLLDTVVGGLPLPFINTFFGGVDLHTTVADLMRAGALSASFLKGVGQMAMAGSGGGFSGRQMLAALNISGGTRVNRGSSSILRSSGRYAVSESGSILVGNADASAVKGKTLADAADQQSSEMAAATAESGDPLSTVNLKTALPEALAEASILAEIRDAVMSIDKYLPEAFFKTQAASLIASSVNYYSNLSNIQGMLNSSSFGGNSGLMANIQDALGGIDANAALLQNGIHAANSVAIGANEDLDRLSNINITISDNVAKILNILETRTIKVEVATVPGISGGAWSQNLGGTV